jgi:hypothetical protein
LYIKLNIARARGDDAAALAYAEEYVAIARGWNLYNMLGRAFSMLARVHVDQGRDEHAEPLVAQVLAMTDERGSPWFRWLIDLGWLLHDLGRPETPPSTPYPVWNDTSHAIARGELAAAAEMLAATDLVSEEAYARLRSAEQLAADGRHADAQVHAERAAAFYRSVDATAYLRRAEALVPVFAPEV